MGTDLETATNSSVPGNAKGRGRTGAHLFLVFSADWPATWGARLRIEECTEVVVGRGATRSFTLDPAKKRWDVQIPDRRLSSEHARITRVVGKWAFEDRGSKNGSRLNGEACDRAELADGDVIELGRSFFVFRDGLEIDPDRALLDDAALASSPLAFRTLVPSLARELERLATMARSKVDILIEGETGTGKEILARAIHETSGRGGAFVGVNCAALPADLVVAELSGHKKGAFSGATDDQLGLVRAAQGGTLFLDEIGDMPLGAQAALLRILQEREIRPVGATRSVPVDIRVLCATNRSLEAMAAEGTFRSDLLARIAGFRFTTRPLRERREDLGALSAALAARHRGEGGAEQAPPLSAAAARALLQYAWVGNVRELEKCLDAALVLGRATGTIEIDHLPALVQAAGEPAPDERKAQLEAWLTEHKGNISAVARATGKARMQIQRWVKRYGIDPDAFRRD